MLVAYKARMLLEICWVRGYLKRLIIRSYFKRLIREIPAALYPRSFSLLFSLLAADQHPPSYYYPAVRPEPNNSCFVFAIENRTAAPQKDASQITRLLYTFLHPEKPDRRDP
jgi:hypothetical protein